MKKRGIWRSVCCRLDQLEDELNGLRCYLQKPKNKCFDKSEFCNCQETCNEKCEQKNGRCC